MLHPDGKLAVLPSPSLLTETPVPTFLNDSEPQTHGTLNIPRSKNTTEMAENVFSVEEHASLWHGQQAGGNERDGCEYQSEHEDVVVGYEVEADEQLTHHRAHGVSEELDAAAVRHIGEIGHLAGCDHPVAELHGLHGRHAFCPPKQSSGGKEHHTLEDHHRFVTQPIREQEDRHQHGQILLVNAIRYTAPEHTAEKNPRVSSPHLAQSINEKSTSASFKIITSNGDKHLAKAGTKCITRQHGATQQKMRLKRFLLRYYPPGIILEYERGGYLRTKSIDLLDLTPECELKAHILPLTNIAFNKSGSRFITGSYDRTCRVWDTASGTELHTLEGHRNVVYAIAFNNPYGDKIATGSFDKTCKLWCAETGKCFHTFCGHRAEIVCLAFNPQSTLVATGSMDATAKLWDVESGKEVATLTGHTVEVLSLCFNTVGNHLVTGSFDYTVAIWDVASKRRVHTLIGHLGEISNVQFNWDCSLIASGSTDKTCKLWDAVSGKCVATLVGHREEVLDVCFDLSGQLIATASADGTAKIFNAATHQCLVTLKGHDKEISKICFSPQGSRVLTASSDKTARLWDVQSGACLQILEGHTDEIFSCAFNYEGDTIITGGLLWAQVSLI
ncbi:hypothetical protein CCH79_00003685 [Gambusia affinis]|uniref:Uncharacterized protein n=1 Tax=Gambusia affinis TaxID=33528 RepID=A0A315VBJ0_GAMAF|nr:hypothetical protein CCH79_00003685 [Gambusia affinis]